MKNDLRRVNPIVLVDCKNFFTEKQKLRDRGYTGYVIVVASSPIPDKKVTLKRRQWVVKKALLNFFSE